MLQLTKVVDGKLVKEVGLESHSDEYLKQGWHITWVIPAEEPPLKSERKRCYYGEDTVYRRRSS